jgi:hypothetical protein
LLQLKQASALVTQAIANRIASSGQNALPHEVVKHGAQLRTQAPPMRVRPGGMSRFSSVMLAVCHLGLTFGENLSD